MQPPRHCGAVHQERASEVRADCSASIRNHPPQVASVTQYLHTRRLHCPTPLVYSETSYVVRLRQLVYGPVLV